MQAWATSDNKFNEILVAEPGEKNVVDINAQEWNPTTGTKSVVAFIFEKQHHHRGY